jgi:hypothetical protein
VNSKSPESCPNFTKTCSKTELLFPAYQGYVAVILVVASLEPASIRLLVTCPLLSIKYSPAS